ncbi:MAG: Gfo/Idh/MocA family oxidoreductase [Acidobacteria bacterium]|nr:Gfo/Idh/MocA family oxidoreductase [Acidobacteriota bacterium]
MARIRTAIIGTGFMGRVHTEGVRRLGNVDVAAVAGSSAESAAKFGASIGVEQTTGNYKDILKDPSIQAVHILTPNALHYPMSMAALEAGKAVLCEKPMTMTSKEADGMVKLAAKKKLPNAVCHNLRYYPVVQHIRQYIAAGELGEILHVQGTYSQDWLLYDTDFNWRIDAKANGRLRAVGDIGSHWMDMIQHLTGLSITGLCADLATFHKTRRRPKVAIQTFAGKKLQPSDYEEVKITTEDYGGVLLHLGDRVHGAYTVSQVAAGNKNRFQFEIYGTKGGVMWNQERPDELWLGNRNEPNKIIIKDPSLLMGSAAGFADLPGGHSEGYDDSHKQLYRRFYAHVADPSAPVDYPTFADGLRGMILLEAIVESAKKKGWVKVKTKK